MIPDVGLGSVLIKGFCRNVAADQGEKVIRVLSHEVMAGIWEMAVMKALHVGETYVAHLACQRAL